MRDMNPGREDESIWHVRSRGSSGKREKRQEKPILKLLILEGIRIVSITGRALCCAHSWLPRNRRRRKCAHSHRGAAPAVSVSPLRRELSRSHEHRLRDARDERRSGSDRFGLRHGERNFLHRIFRAANSRGAAGGTLERKASARDNAYHLGRTDNAHRFRAHSDGTLRRAIFTRRSRGGVFSRA